VPRASSSKKPARHSPLTVMATEFEITLKGQTVYEAVVKTAPTLNLCNQAESAAHTNKHSPLETSEIASPSWRRDSEGHPFLFTTPSPYTPRVRQTRLDSHPYRPRTTPGARPSPP
jgi:hypothetical protein